MNVLRILHFVAAGLLIVACQGAGTTPQASGSRASLRHFQGAGSWLSPMATQRPLIYTSAIYVNIYTYSGNQVGQLRGFSDAKGLCSDVNGNVYVVDAGAQVVYEYAPGGTLPINVIDDGGQLPNGCAVDPSTGNIAVANTGSGLGQKDGNLLVYPPGSFAAPITYTLPAMEVYMFCGYDAAGNLYVDGVGDKGTFQLAELPGGGNALVSIAIPMLNHRSHRAGGLQWDGQYLAVDDALKRLIYRLAISGSQGSVADTVRIKGLNRTYIAEFSIQGKTMLFPLSGGRMAFYKYPQGGRPTKGFVGSVGPYITVSLPPTPK